MSRTRFVVGIDVGGASKGYHAVGLSDFGDVERFHSCDSRSILNWCSNIDAKVVAVDAPCRWSKTGRARPAERALMGKGISCFATPTQNTAETHPTNHFGWMLRGAELFAELEKHYKLFVGATIGCPEGICFETYPHAIACALNGSVITSKCKATVRRALLAKMRVNTSDLPNVDSVDAALCALTALYFIRGEMKTYGEPDTGFIVVPA